MRSKIQSILVNSKWHIICSLFLILLYFSPFIYFGEDSHIVIHDNLDSNVSWVKTVLNSGEFFSAPNKKISQVFNGISRSSLYGTYDFSLIWFKLFGMYFGYIFNKIIMSVLGFFGMYYLLKKIITPRKSSLLIITGVALLFSLLPFWSFTLSVSGLPLLLFAFLNIRDGEKHYSNWVIIVLFPFYSSLVLSGIFFIIIMGLLFIYDLYKNRKINVPFIMGLILMGGMYLISHFPIFYSFLIDSDYVSHRTEMVIREINFNESYKRWKSMFVSGQYHAHSLHTYIIYPILLVFVIKLFIKKKDKIYIATIAFLFVTSVLYGILNWKTTVPFFSKIMAIFPLQISRFHFLHPMFWYLLLGIALVFVSKRYKYGNFLVIGILFFQLIFILKNHEFITQKDNPSYSRFYSEQLFDDINDFIGKPQDSYRVVSIGIHPSIALYNGFYTLDGYFPDYSLEYKHKFRKVISKELDKSPYLTRYFDTWGSRCYAYTRELSGAYHLNPNPKTVTNLEFDFEALKNMGGKYIISSAAIEVANIEELELLKVFEHARSEWKIRLYELVD